MKFLKYLFGIVLLLFIIFIALGFITPSISYESEIVVNKPASEAWAVMSDQEQVPKWLEGFKRSELVSGEANTVGAVSNIYVEENGQEMMMTETIKEFNANERIAMEFSMDFMNMDYSMDLKEENGKTRITSKSTVAGNHIFARSMVSLMPSVMKAQEDSNMNRLKEVINANTKNYSQKKELEIVE